MPRIASSDSEPSRITVFQWRLLRWYPGITAGFASRSASASSGSHLRLTRSESAPSWERANIFPLTLNTEVSAPNGNVSSAPVKERQCLRSSLGFTASAQRASTRDPDQIDQAPSPRHIVPLARFDQAVRRGLAASLDRIVPDPRAYIESEARPTRQKRTPSTRICDQAAPRSA